MLKRGYALAAACLAAAVAVTAFTPNGKFPTLHAADGTDPIHRHRNAIATRPTREFQINIKTYHCINWPYLHLRHILCHSFAFVLVKLLVCN